VAKPDKVEQIVLSSDPDSFATRLQDEFTASAIREVARDYGVAMGDMSPVEVRRLYNRIIGSSNGCKPFGQDPIGEAMDIHKADWLRVYTLDGHVYGVQPWYELVQMINDTLQQHGHEGVWGGNITYAKVEEGFSYRCLYHDDQDCAWEEEFYSLLFGWW